ncbi:MAG: hypothetical protein PHH28_07725 [Desulfuromonadaceae bacterium]|nr:hypothetical protein [Desulfuromonadaceae bacterium]
MKNLIFRELLLISHSEKRARRIKFHPTVTIIKGENDTGKSSVIKSIYAALGANSAVVHPEWKKADVFLFLTFEVSGTTYKILRMRDRYALFTKNDIMLGTYKRITSELGPKLADLLNFKLVLVDKKEQEVVPPPAYLFVPFYIDQEHSWSKSMTSFDRLQQLPNWRKDVIYYHTGIKPNEYYQLRAKCQVMENDKVEPLGQERLLLKFKERFGKEALNNEVTLDVNVFESEIKDLMTKCDTLKAKEEKFRNTLFELESERIRLEAQRNIVIHAQRELDADYLYTNTLPVDGVIACPTCGQEYENHFAERFNIANDHQKCVTLLQDILTWLDELNKKIAEHRKTLGETNVEIKEIEQIMNKKSGDITLLTLLKSMSSEHITSSISENIQEVRSEIGEIDSRIREIVEEMKKFEDKDRVATICDYYKDVMGRNLYNLNVSNVSPKSYARIESAIKETGSDMPRAILAYNFAIMATIAKHGTSVMCPIVIDSPNQQDQDVKNYDGILKFIRDNVPSGSQTIIGLVDDYKIDFGGDVIQMSEKWHALSQYEYDEIAEELKPFEVAIIGTTD